MLLYGQLSVILLARHEIGEGPPTKYVTRDTPGVGVLQLGDVTVIQK